MGAMNLNVFTAGTDHGGTDQLVASYPSGQQQTAQATIHVRVHGSFQGPDCMGGGAACSRRTTRRSCGGTDITPQIVYPPDGVLLPPNMESSPCSARRPGEPATTEFEIDFDNANTDVRVVTKCKPQPSTRAARRHVEAAASSTLDAAMWDFIAKSNQGGDPVKITVRATTDGTCASPSTNSVNIVVRRAGRQRRHLLLEVDGLGVAAPAGRSGARVRRRDRRRSRSPAPARWAAPASAATRCRATASA